MRTLLLTLLLFTLSVSSAEEQNSTPDEVNQSDQSNQSQGEDRIETEQTDPAPEADNLRNRGLGDAFKNFQPSEEISADNAVTFPVDI